MNILKNKNCNIKINDEEIPIELYRKTNNEFVKYVRYDDYKKLENIIKEVREYIDKEHKLLYLDKSGYTYTKTGSDILEILDKVDKGE